MLGSDTHHLLEHGGEGSRARIAEVESERRDALPVQQARKRPEETGTPPPCREGEPRLPLEPAREGSTTHRQIPTPDVDRLLCAGMFEERRQHLASCSPEGSGRLSGNAGAARISSIANDMIFPVRPSGSYSAGRSTASIRS